jgi:GT2 family glycosyltransferase
LYVPAFNGERYIASCITAILAQTLPPDEVLIVDDGSSDRTTEIAGRFPVTIIRHEVNRGLAAARNTGLRNARNNLVASLDQDCVAAPDWLEQLSARFPGDRTALGGGRLEEGAQRTAADRFRKLHVRGDFGTESKVNPWFVHGSNTLARKDAIAAVGWYDERFWTSYEDVDISERLRAGAYNLYYEPSAVVYHIKQDDNHSVLRTLWRYNRLGYRRAINLPNVLSRVVQNTAWSIRCVMSDLRSEDWGVLRLDLIFPVYFARWDWRLLLETRASASAEGGRKRISRFC